MKYILSIILTAICCVVSAQNLPERGELRRGNEAYESGDFQGAAEHYSKSMAIAPEGFEARFNLANALIKTKKMEGADQMLKSLAADSLSSVRNRSESFYNLGNSQFEQQKLEEALESYKDAIRLNPDDTEAKYNYSYVKSLLEAQQQNQDQQQDQDQQDQGDDNQEQNQDQKQDQGDQEDEGDQGDQEDQGDQNQDQQDQDQGDGEDEQDGEPQPQDGEISEQELQQMLDAIQAQEDKTQEDLEKRARGVVVPGAKNW